MGRRRRPVTIITEVPESILTEPVVRFVFHQQYPKKWNDQRRWIYFQQCRYAKVVTELGEVVGRVVDVLWSKTDTFVYVKTRYSDPTVMFIPYLSRQRKLTIN